MAYTARGLIDYARSLADLQETQFISYDDEINLINEAYRDVYSRYIESDGDYWDIETIINITGAVVDPNNPFAYIIPLPSDFLKIRSLSYNNGGYWLPVNKFSISNRDNNPSQPTYRLKNNTLWLIGGRSIYSQLKLSYYPVVQTLTAPDNPQALATGETIFTIPNITSHTYDGKNGIFYYIKGQSIYMETVATGVTTTIYTAAFAIDNIQYWAGKLYFRNTATSAIWSGAVASTMTPAAISGPTGVLSFNIQSNLIYYVTASATRSCSLTGTSDALVVGTSYPQYQLYGSVPLAIVGGVLYVNGLTTGVAASQVRNDGVYIYLLSSNTVSRYTFAAGAPVLSGVVSTDIVSIGNQIIAFDISMQGYEAVEGVSLVPDSVLTYPANEVNEILAYTSAIAYSRKQDNAAKLATLTARLQELWDRFWSVNKRDEYQFTRINNDYQQTLNNW